MEDDARKAPRPVVEPTLDWPPRLVNLALRLSIPLYKAADAVLGGLSRFAFSSERVHTDRYLLRPKHQDAEPDASVGLIVTRADAPGLFHLFEDLARKLGGVFPSEVRIAYLPACGVLDLSPEPGDVHQVLVIGLPCLQIWSVDELRAVLAHELAHLKQDDAIFTRDILQFSGNLRELVQNWPRAARWWNARFNLARLSGWLFLRAASYVSREMELRADGTAARCAGAMPLASAIEKLAVVQPIFREVLRQYDPVEQPGFNVYDLFQRMWQQLPRPQYGRLRHRLVDEATVTPLDPHPPILERIARLKARRLRFRRRGSVRALAVLKDPGELMRVLHNRLYGARRRTHSVFHKFTSN